MNYAIVYTDMLANSSRIRYATCCNVITERTIPVDTPIEIYRCATGVAPKCAIDPTHNVSFHKCPLSLLLQLNRGKPFQLVNN